MKCGCGCACSSGTTKISDEEKRILAAMEACGGPCGTKDIAEATGYDSKSISAKIGDLKKQGYVDSPARCKYGVTEQGRQILKP